MLALYTPASPLIAASPTRLKVHDLIVLHSFWQLNEGSPILWVVLRPFRVAGTSP
jgi:hypothetical protein